MTAPTQGVDDTVGRIETEVALMLRLSDRNRRRSKLMDGALERSAYLALRLLESNGPCTITRIADELRLDGSTVTRQVVAMEEAGHVCRGRDPHDGRLQVISATDEGLDALARTRVARGTVYREVLADWSDDDQATLAEMLPRLNADLDSHLDS